MKLLPHGCRCSEPAVHPKNWARANASTKKNWYIHYRFYDDSQRDLWPSGRFCMVKGMNDLKDVAQRQQDTRDKLAELTRLLEAGYNPITGFVPELTDDEVVDYEIAPTTPLDQALQEAQQRYKAGPRHMYNIKCHTVHIVAAVIAKGLHRMAVAEVKKRHIVRLMEALAAKLKLSNNNFNNYLKTVRTLFTVLEDLEAVEFNPAEKVRTKTVVRKKRTALSDEQRVAIKTHVTPIDPEFARLLEIFFHSGGRETELFRLKAKNVDLTNQVYQAVIMKGGADTGRTVDKVIPNEALPLWIAALEGAEPDDYVFGIRRSQGLKCNRWIICPSPHQMDPAVFQKRWRKWVKSEKTGLGIKQDAYNLKHTRTTKLAAMNEQAAADMNSHTSKEMNMKHYDLMAEDRKRDALKTVVIPFAPNRVATG